MNRNLALLGFAGRQRTESLMQRSCRTHTRTTQTFHRSGAWHHARRHLDSTTVHLYADETLDLAEAELNGWQQKQRLGVQVINASPGASHLEFAQVVA